MVKSTTLVSPLWLTVIGAIFTVVSASNDVTQITSSHFHRHHASHFSATHHHGLHSRNLDHDYLSENKHRQAWKRSFGKALRIWTPAQGPPLRRSASGQALEPFEEDAFPGWTFGNVYDIPPWDGGDKAACRTATPLPISVRIPATKDADDEQGRAVKRPDHVRRATLSALHGDTGSNFCSVGNRPVDVPSETACNMRGRVSKPSTSAMNGDTAPLVRRSIAELWTGQQVLHLVTAAFADWDASKPSHAASPQNMPPLAESLHLHARSPLGPMMAMGGGMGGMQMLTQLMPIILAGIQAGAQVGVALMQYLEATQLQKAQLDAQKTHNTSADKTARRSIADNTGCAGSAQLCVSLIEASLPYCHALQDDGGWSQWGEFGDASTTFVDKMAMHCEAKCSGFAELAKERERFQDRVRKCAGDSDLFSREPAAGAPSTHTEPFEHLSEGTSYSGVDLHSNGQRKSDTPTPRSKRSLSNSVTTPQCRAGYQTLFSNALRPVHAYSNKLFGSVISDPRSSLHWGLVKSTNECLVACDQTEGCVFANVYQQSFSLENPSIKLISRSPPSMFKVTEEQAEGEGRKKQFASQSERKKNSFVQGQLTCALYKRCFGECEAGKASGGGSPVFFERSMGYCKSKQCAV